MRARGHCALARANRVFCTDKKRIRTENTVMKKRPVWGGFYIRSSISRGCAFHPREIEDPRGRFLVRAMSQLCNNEGRDLSRNV